MPCRFWQWVYLGERFIKMVDRRLVGLRMYDEYDLPLLVLFPATAITIEQQNKSGVGDNTNTVEKNFPGRPVILN